MNNKNLKKNIIVQGSILALASIIVRIIGLIYRIPLTRILGDAAMGYYSYAFEIYNLALILSSYSLPLAVSKLVSARVSKGEYKKSHKLFIVSLIFGAAVGAVATILLYMFADAYGALIKNQYVAIPLRVLAPTIFVFSVMGVIRGFFQGHSNMVPTAISQIIEQIVNAIVSIVAAYFMLKAHKGEAAAEAYGAAGGTLGTFSGAVAAFITLIIIYMIYKPLLDQRRRNDSTEVSETSIYLLKILLATAIPVIISQTIYQVSGTLDSIIYNLIASRQGVSENIRSTIWGIYSNKYKLLTNVPIAVASAMGTAIVPSLIADYTLGNTKQLHDKISIVVKFNMIIAFPCAIGFAVLSGPILELLFNDSNIMSANFLSMGSICIVFFALSTVTNGILQGIHKMNIPVYHSAISLVIHIPLLIILMYILEDSYYSLIICNVLFPFIVCILNWRSISKYADYKQEIKTTFIIPFISALIMGIFCFGFYKILSFLGNSAGTLLSIFLSALIYFIVLIKLKGVTAEEMIKMPKGRMLVKIFRKIHLL